jgi:hypothetical protein
MQLFMCRYDRVVLENYVCHADLMVAITVTLDTYSPEGSPYFLFLMPVAVLEMDTQTGRLF